jgi:hypothetical protein
VIKSRADCPKTTAAKCFENGLQNSTIELGSVAMAPREPSAQRVITYSSGSRQSSTYDTDGGSPEATFPRTPQSQNCFVAAKA